MSTESPVSPVINRTVSAASDRLPGKSSRFKSAVLILKVLPGYLCYLAFHIVASPWLSIKGILRAKKRDYFGFILQRLLPRNRPVGCTSPIVIMCTHLGETRTALLAARELGTDCERNCPTVIIPSTRQAYDVARSTVDERQVAFAPFNNPLSVCLFLYRWRPSVVMFVEYSDCHHLTFMSSLLGVRTVVFNMRISEAEHNAAKRSPLDLWRFRCVSAFATQSENHRRRLLDLGVEAERVTVTGASMAAELTDSDDMQTIRAVWLVRMSLGRRTESERQHVIVAGSTYHSEELIILDAFEAFRAVFPNAVLIIAPRKLNRPGGDDSALKMRPVNFARRSQFETRNPDCPVVLLDTYGELQEVYSIATLTYIGGSFDTGIGAHTPVEALAWGTPLTIGPEFTTQEALVDMLMEQGVLTVCKTSQELVETWISACSDEAGRETVRANSARLIAANSHPYRDFLRENAA